MRSRGRANFPTRASVLAFGFLALLGGFPSFARPPDWVRETPRLQGAYVGIGRAEKSAGSRDHVERARNDALAEIASQIAVSLSRNVLDTVRESGGVFEEDLRAEIRIDCRADLEGYELVDSWEDSNEYWVYYRLAQEVYEEARANRARAAGALALHHLESARARRREGTLAAAMQDCVQALHAVRKFWTEPVRDDATGATVYPRVEALSALQSLMTCVDVEARAGERSGRAGRGLDAPLEAEVVCRCPELGAPLLSALPITYRFVRGTGDLLGDTFTDRSGVSRAQIARLSAGSGPQLVVAELDPLRWIPADSLSTIVHSALADLPKPNARFVITVRGASVRLESSEASFSKPLPMARLGGRLKSELLAAGVEFVRTLSEADYLVSVRADTRRGSEFEGLFTARADVEVTVQDLTTGQEIFRQSLEGVKGIQLSYEQAGIAACEAAEQKLVEEVLPRIRAVFR